jgi:hypothetical protein
MDRRAFISMMGGGINSASQRLAELAIAHRLPTMFQGKFFVEAGGLMSYYHNRADTWRRAARYVDKILRGARPADLPVEQVATFELVINLKTAKTLGLTIPQSLLMRADQVIRRAPSPAEPPPPITRSRERLRLTLRARSGAMQARAARRSCRRAR